MDAYLGVRTVVSNLSSCSLKLRLAKGCLQGGVLFPLQCSLVVVDLLAEKLNREGGVYAQGYTDHICILGMGRFPGMVSDLVQGGI